MAATEARVALLSGVGGAGKTATIDALLRRRGVLASATPPEKGDAEVLVFSFSEGTPEQLRDELRSWASSSAEDVTVTGWQSRSSGSWRMHRGRGQA